jgi:peptide/nickel transport system permease protein
MIGYLIRRLGQGVIVMLVVAALSFTMFNFVGDPLVGILGTSSTGIQRDQLRQELGLNRPEIVQFGDFLWRAVHGDFGISYRLGQPVSAILMERLPATVELAVAGMVLAILMGVPAGVYAALHRRRATSRLFLAGSLLGISVPSFFMGVLFIWIFSVELGWLPSFGRGDTVRIGWWTTGLLTLSGLRSIILPALTIAVFQIAMIMRLVRAEMLGVMRADFIRFARARGLPDRAVHFRHALRNTLVPVVTIVGLQLGSLIAFAVITESVFQWPGLGLLFLQSVSAADIPVMSAYLVLVGLLFVGINLLVDVLYLVIDPRLRSGRGAPGSAAGVLGT